VHLDAQSFRIIATWTLQTSRKGQSAGRACSKVYATVESSVADSHTWSGRSFNWAIHPLSLSKLNVDQCVLIVRHTPWLGPSSLGPTLQLSAALLLIDSADFLSIATLSIDTSLPNLRFQCFLTKLDPRRLLLR